MSALVEMPVLRTTFLPYHSFSLANAGAPSLDLVAHNEA